MRSLGKGNTSCEKSAEYRFVDILGIVQDIDGKKE